MAVTIGPDPSRYIANAFSPFFDWDKSQWERERRAHLRSQYRFAKEKQDAERASWGRAADIDLLTKEAKAFNLGQAQADAEGLAQTESIAREMARTGMLPDKYIGLQGGGETPVTWPEVIADRIMRRKKFENVPLTDPTSGFQGAEDITSKTKLRHPLDPAILLAARAYQARLTGIDPSKLMRSGFEAEGARLKTEALPGQLAMQRSQAIIELKQTRAEIAATEALIRQRNAQGNLSEAKTQIERLRALEMKQKALEAQYNAQLQAGALQGTMAILGNRPVSLPNPDWYSYMGEDEGGLPLEPPPPKEHTMGRFGEGLHPDMWKLVNENLKSLPISKERLEDLYFNYGQQQRPGSITEPFLEAVNQTGVDIANFANWANRQAGSGWTSLAPRDEHLLEFGTPEPIDSSTIAGKRRQIDLMRQSQLQRRQIAESMIDLNSHLSRIKHEYGEYSPQYSTIAATMAKLQSRLDSIPKVSSERIDALQQASQGFTVTSDKYNSMMNNVVPSEMEKNISTGPEGSIPFSIAAGALEGNEYNKWNNSVNNLIKDVGVNLQSQLTNTLRNPGTPGTRLILENEQDAMDLQYRMQNVAGAFLSEMNKIKTFVKKDDELTKLQIQKITRLAVEAVLDPSNRGIDPFIDYMESLSNEILEGRDAGAVAAFKDPIKPIPIKTFTLSSNDVSKIYGYPKRRRGESQEIPSATLDNIVNQLSNAFTSTPLSTQNDRKVRSEKFIDDEDQLPTGSDTPVGSIYFLKQTLSPDKIMIRVPSINSPDILEWREIPEDLARILMGNNIISRETFEEVY